MAVVNKAWSDSSSKKDSGLESGDVSDASEEQQPTSSRLKKSPVHQEPLTEAKKPMTHISVLDSSKKISLLNKPAPSSAVKPVHEMKIQSALATSIMQLRKGVLTKTKSFDTSPKVTQMVSVLKNPPAATTPQKVLGNMKESIVTTMNSSNSRVQNIIVQEAVDIDLPQETEKKPPRRKLNLAEYRSRREQTRSDGSRTNSPVQPMVLVYIHHVSTNTEPINDDPENPIWSEREIVSVLKPKSEMEEEKARPKPLTVDRITQTNETVLGVYYKENVNDEEPLHEQCQTSTTEYAVVENPTVNITIKKEVVQEEMEFMPEISEIQNIETSCNQVAKENITVDDVETINLDDTSDNQKLINNDVKVIADKNETMTENETMSTATITSDCEIIAVSKKVDSQDESIIIIKDEKGDETDKKAQKTRYGF